MGGFFVWFFLFGFLNETVTSVLARNQEDHIFFLHVKFIKAVVIFPVNREQSICEWQHCLEQNL